MLLDSSAPRCAWENSLEQKPVKFLTKSFFLKQKNKKLFIFDFRAFFLKMGLRAGSC